MFFEFISKSLQEPPRNFAVNLVNYFTVEFEMEETELKAVAEDPNVPLPTGCYPKSVGCHCCPGSFFQ